MGALPDREPPAGAEPYKSPDQAPPLFAVPGARSEPAPATPPAPPKAAQRPAPPAASPATSVEPAVEEKTGGLDLDKVTALRAWAVEHLRPPDLLNESSPGLKGLWEQALKGDHLPDNPVVRVAEVARLVVSLPLIGVAVLLAWSCVSAARQAALALAVLAVWVLASTLVSAVTDLL